LSISRKTFPLLAALLTALLMLPAAANAAQPEALHYVKLFPEAQLNQSQPPVEVDGVDPAAGQVTLHQIVDDSNGVGTAQEIGTTNTVSPQGLATVTPTDPLVDGSHTLAVTQTVDGEVSNLDWTHTRVDVNTAAPTLERPADGQLTSDTNPYFDVSGALHNSGAPQANAQVAIYVDGQLAGQDTSDGGGGAGIQLDESLADGAHTAYAVTVDDLGNTGEAHSNTVHFTVDTTAPDAPVVVSPASGSTVTTASPQVVVHTEPGAHVSLFIEDTQDGAYLTADDAGDATFTPNQALADGTHTLYACASDAADNWSDARVTQFTVKTAKPTTTTTPTPTPTPTPTVPPTPKQPTLLLAPGKVTLSSHTLTAKNPVKVSLTLSKPGTVKLTVTKVVKGRIATVATVTVKVAKAGKGSYTLHTKVGEHKLAKGSYKLTLQTVSKHKKSKAVTQKVTVR
jgi:hypothetical protein